MFSLAFVVVALVDFAVLVWATRSARVSVLKGLHTVRFLVHYIALPMTFIAIGAMAREADTLRYTTSISALSMTAMMILFGVYSGRRRGEVDGSSLLSDGTPQTAGIQSNL